MFLDLIIADKYTFTSLLDLPMSMSKAVPTSRTMDSILEHFITDYKRYDKGSHKKDIRSDEFIAMTQATADLLVDWLALKGCIIDEDHTLQTAFTQVSGLISTAINDWLHIDLNASAASEGAASSRNAGYTEPKKLDFGYDPQSHFINTEDVLNMPPLGQHTGAASTSDGG
jgi:hypothetical protein